MKPYFQILVCVCLISTLAHGQDQPPPRIEIQIVRPKPGTAEPPKTTPPVITIVRPMPMVPKEEKPPTPVIQQAALTTPAAPVSFNTESSRLFSTRVMPILNNLCSSCHNHPETAGSFVLKRMDQGFANPEAIEFNIRAAARQIDPKSPAYSPLLQKAVLAHGQMKEPPIRTKQLPAYRTLEQWVLWAAMPDGTKTMPTTPATTVIQASQISPTIAAPKTSEFANPMPNGMVPSISSPPGSKSTDEPGKLPPLVPPKENQPVPAPAPTVDPFDPAIFNQYANPKRK